MLVGTADIDVLAQNAATLSEFSSDPVELQNVVCFQLTAEMKNSAREAVLPPALHPTVPAALSVQVYDVGDSPWGAFRFATARISCRSGVRARGFTTATIVDDDAACRGLANTLGFPAKAGVVEFRHGYDGVTIMIHCDGEKALAINAIDPDPMGPDDVQYTGTLNLANTPMGLRLLQVEANAATTQVDRLQASMAEFNGAIWGNERLQPTHIIAASVVRMDLTYPAIRFVCKADELAFTGTEAVGASTD